MGQRINISRNTGTKNYAGCNWGVEIKHHLQTCFQLRKVRYARNKLIVLWHLSAATEVVTEIYQGSLRLSDLTALSHCFHPSAITLAFEQIPCNGWKSRLAAAKLLLLVESSGSPSSAGRAPPVRAPTASELQSMRSGAALWASVNRGSHQT